MTGNVRVAARLTEQRTIRDVAFEDSSGLVEMREVQQCLHAMQEILLVTIPFSHYCEKARWSLDRANVVYREEMHVPLLHMVGVLRVGGKRTVPVLTTPGGLLTESTDILRWADLHVSLSDRLFPSEDELRVEVEKWEDAFDEKLGPHTRRWGYGMLLPEREATQRIMGKYAPVWEHHVLRATWPWVEQLMRRGMNINDAKVAQSKSRVEEMFARVGSALADGRKYLVGDRFTAADLAFAALSAPVLLPDVYAQWMASPEELPQTIADAVYAMRETDAGRYAMRIYKEHRAQRV